jgi:hypothetical protein
MCIRTLSSTTSLPQRELHLLVGMTMMPGTPISAGVFHALDIYDSAGRTQRESAGRTQRESAEPVATGQDGGRHWIRRGLFPSHQHNPATRLGPGMRLPPAIPRVYRGGI